MVSSPTAALSNPEVFNYGVETYEAYKQKSLASDITDEQKKVGEADLVIFQVCFPPINILNQIHLMYKLFLNIEFCAASRSGISAFSTVAHLLSKYYNLVTTPSYNTSPSYNTTLNTLPSCNTTFNTLPNGVKISM